MSEQLDGSLSLKALDVSAFLASRPADSHKGTYGYIALIGGSLRYSGAAKLANWAACSMASGAGVVKLAVPRCIAHAATPYLLESTLFPLADDGDNFVFVPEQIDELTRNTRTVAVGMGLGNTPATQALVAYLMRHYEGNLLLDADGLNALCALGLDKARESACRLFFTPHLGEFASLCFADGRAFTPDMGPDERALVAKAFALDHRVNLLLKGPTTLVTDGDVLYRVTRGCAGMATAGSGDVLSGIAAAMISNSAAIQHADVPNPYCLALACAAYLNGLAGELAQADQTPVSMTASDTAQHVKAALKQLLG